MSFISSRIPTEAEMPRIILPTGENFGRELSIALYDQFDQMIDGHIRSLVETRGEAPAVLDIGGATGYRAAHLSGIGACVWVLDIHDNTAAIAQRNQVRGNAAPIGFIKGDVRIIEMLDLSKYQWSLINARRLLHWMSWEETKNFLTALPKAIKTPNTRIALCFQTMPGITTTCSHPKSFQNYFYQHPADDVVGLMRDWGYDIIAHGAEALDRKENYAIFAKLPGPAVH